MQIHTPLFSPRLTGTSGDVSIMELNVEELVDKKNCYFETNEKEAEDIDLFGSEFCGDSEESAPNPYNLKNVGHLCENLTPDGGVKKLMVKRGTGDVVPGDANVTIKYTAFTEFRDAPFDVAKKPVNMDIGMSTFRGLSIALASMRKGEKSNFYITPDYAFGRLGCPPVIPPNSTCLYIIELLDYEEMAGAGEYYDRPGEERKEASYEIFLSVVKTKMKEAKDLFGKEKYYRAKQIYETMAFKLRSYDEQDNPEWKQLIISLNSNAALSCLKMGDFEECIKFADVALSHDLKFVKALYAKGKALSVLGMTESAIKYLLEAKKLNPKNKEINQQLQNLEMHIKKCNKDEKDLCQKMMSHMRTENENEFVERGDPDKHIDVSSILHERIIEEFQGHLRDMLESSDPTEDMTISSESFSTEELSALEVIAKSMGLKVYWRRLVGCDFIRVSRV